MATTPFIPTTKPNHESTTIIEHTLHTADATLSVRPTFALDKDDFVRLAAAVDPCIERSGGLAGLIVDAPAFPGWENFVALAQHIRFVRDHQRRIKKIALVTESALGNVAETLASHFVSAQIKHFPASEVERAGQWILHRA
jgi:hypothetical protein